MTQKCTKRCIFAHLMSQKRSQKRPKNAKTEKSQHHKKTHNVKKSHYSCYAHGNGQNGHFTKMPKTAKMTKSAKNDTKPLFSNPNLRYLKCHIFTWINRYAHP